jgi:hypothetical protein
MQTLMAGRLVLTRSKGSTPPTDVLTLQDASVFMDEKKGTVSVTSSGRTSSWKGMDLQDTFRWHDAPTSNHGAPAYNLQSLRSLSPEA